MIVACGGAWCVKLHSGGRAPDLIVSSTACDGSDESILTRRLELTERDEKIRVITAYDLDAGQKRDYLKRRAQRVMGPDLVE